ncbi:DUF2989 domain-containing protein [Litorilituus sediminis]|uniref:DUF2989 domain-containing protein n=1 Tax=Litorilituus sediminis TaxID=718192 RepID=A0A4P6P1Y3_9GAMM|nr:DUF2989 domain-containing protein [Litorilituus sediminis]QBG34588.1 DUF2989 domain-containing protein [Litorilituus sediminis]
MKTIIFALVLPLCLIGCDNSKSLADLCQEHEDICSEFTQDSWCKAERINVAFARLDLKEKAQDVHKFHLLVAYEDYIKCMSLASQIEHRKLKEKKTYRTNNLLKAKAALAELSDETATSEHPHLLFYHWTRYTDTVALEKFLKMEGSSMLENTTAQYHLATHYVKRDIKKTLALLFHALELYEPGTVLDPEIFQTLTTIFTNKEKYEQAYIWLKIYQEVETDRKEREIAEQSLNLYKEQYGLNGDFLDKVADSTLDKIYDGKFTAPKF